MTRASSGDIWAIGIARQGDGCVSYSVCKPKPNFKIYDDPATYGRQNAQPSSINLLTPSMEREGSFSASAGVAYAPKCRA